MNAFGNFNPAFCFNKSKKAFGFRVNRVYLTQASASYSNLSYAYQTLVPKPDRSEHSDLSSE
ncbi:hypothetical protein ASE74_16745 [Pedobacter sp. Leaf216]|nr:hypothetical protein ASE74_16745 [Pedobacter sp. Leaf216]